MLNLLSENIDFIIIYVWILLCDTSENQYYRFRYL